MYLVAFSEGHLCRWKTITFVSIIFTSLWFWPLWHPSLPLLPTPVTVSDVGDVWLAAVDTFPSLAPVLHVVVGQLELVGLLTPRILVIVTVRGRVGPLCQVR